MPRIKKKPDLTNIGINPFTETLEIPVNKKFQKAINKYGEVDEREFELEATPYTKVYEVASHKKQVVDLPIRCKELYLWLIHSITKAQDIIWIDRTAYMHQNGIKSPNTFKQALKGLYEALYIYHHATLKDTFWINPHFFFKGSRVNKYKNNVRIVNEIHEK